MHAHPHPPAPENPGIGQGPVLLDIGGDIGALVVTMPADLVGTEIHVALLGAAPGRHDHVAVVNRPAPAGGVVPCLVYPELAAGTYGLRRSHDGPPDLVVEIRGGEVTAADWSAAA